MNHINRAVLVKHRERVASAANFQEFQEAQLDLLDFMLDEINKDTADAFYTYLDKFEEWSSK